MTEMLIKEKVYKPLIDFRSFVTEELAPALIELKRIGDDNSRKHLQKLVYTNMVDRFDYAIDKTILNLVQNPILTNELLGKLTTNVQEGTLLKMLYFGDEEKNKAIERLKDLARNEYLGGRHSKKLQKLFSVIGIDSPPKKPRVNKGTGRIMSTAKHDKKIPLSIIGYSDWLYCRRNVIVHGGGNTHILKRDEAYLTETFGCQPSKTIKIQLATIENASHFYLDIVKLIGEVKPH